MSAPTFTARFRLLNDVPEKTGRYCVAHRGRMYGHAYYTAKEGDTQYPVGWSQWPEFSPTHWLDAPNMEFAGERL